MTSSHSVPVEEGFGKHIFALISNDTVFFCFCFFFSCFFFVFFFCFFLFFFYPTSPLRTGWFLSWVNLVWIQSFPSSRLVARPVPKDLVCPVIYQYEIGSYLPQGHQSKLQQKRITQDLNSGCRYHFLRTPVYAIYWMLKFVILHLHKIF